MTLRRRTLPLVALLLLAIALTGCGSARQLPARRTQSPPARLGGGPPTHVAVVVMENEEYGDVIGARSTPYINQLARGGALALQMYAVSHPSLPNYIALVSGSTEGITDDCTSCTAPGGGVAGQLSSRGISWKAYMEDLPHPCFTGASAGDYARKHDPFIVLDGIRRHPALCRRIVPMTRLSADERAGALPRFIWITPNLCHDMHDCDPATGDRFLSGLLPPLLRALGPRGLLILTWDEGSSDDGCCSLAHGGHIATILAGGLAAPRARLRAAVDHFSTLRTIEDLFELPRLGGAACACTPSLAPLLRGVRAAAPAAPAHRPRGAATPRS